MIKFMLCKVFIDKETGEELSSYAVWLEADDEEATTKGLLAYDKGIDERRIGVKFQNRIPSRPDVAGSVNGVFYYFRYPSGCLEGPRLPASLLSKGKAEKWAATLRAELIRLTFVAGEVVKTELIKDGQTQEVDWF